MTAIVEFIALYLALYAFELGVIAALLTAIWLITKSGIGDA